MINLFNHYWDLHPLCTSSRWNTFFLLGLELSIDFHFSALSIYISTLQYCLGKRYGFATVLKKPLMIADVHSGGFSQLSTRPEMYLVRHKSHRASLSSTMYLHSLSASSSPSCHLAATAWETRARSSQLSPASQNWGTEYNGCFAALNCGRVCSAANITGTMKEGIGQRTLRGVYAGPWIVMKPLSAGATFSSSASQVQE